VPDQRVLELVGPSGAVRDGLDHVRRARREVLDLAQVLSERVEFLVGTVTDAVVLAGQPGECGAGVLECVAVECCHPLEGTRVHTRSLQGERRLDGRPLAAGVVVREGRQYRPLVAVVELRPRVPGGEYVVQARFHPLAGRQRRQHADAVGRVGRDRVLFGEVQ